MLLGAIVVIVAGGVALLVRLLAEELQNRSAPGRAIRTNQRLWPWIAAFAIFSGGVLGFASVYQSEDPLRFVALGIFLGASLILFAWRLNRR